MFIVSNCCIYLFICYINIANIIQFFSSVLQAQSDDDDVGPDDVNVAVEGGFMDEFFSEVSLND